jgi:O-antigen/teichoic acid export membrane protein
MDPAPAVSVAASDVRVPGGGRLLASRVVQYAALFAANVLVARALGPSERAQYALPLALMALVLVLVGMSVDQASGRALGRREASLGELVGLACAVSVGLGLTGAAVCLVVGGLAADQLLAGASTTAIALAAAAVPFGLAANAFGGLLLRTGRFAGYGAVSAAAGLAQLGGVVLFELGPGLTAERALLVFAVATAMMAAGYGAILSREARRRRTRIALPARRVAGRVLRDGLVLQGASIGLFLVFRIDLLLVAALTDARQAGLYSLATSLGEIVFVAAVTLAQTGIHRITEDPPDAAARFTVAFTRRVVALGAGVAVLVAAAAYPGILLLYGRAWLGSVLPLVILVFAAVAITLAGPSQAYLVREGRLRDISAITLGTLLANVVLNLVLIPLMGIAGAALASLLTYWALALLLTRRFRRLVGGRSLISAGAGER